MYRLKVWVLAVKLFEVFSNWQRKKEFLQLSLHNLLLKSFTYLNAIFKFNHTIRDICNKCNWKKNKEIECTQIPNSEYEKIQFAYYFRNGFSIFAIWVFEWEPNLFLKKVKRLVCGKRAFSKFHTNRIFSSLLAIENYVCNACHKNGTWISVRISSV